MTYNAYAPYYYQQAPQQYYPNQPLPQASNTVAAPTLPTLPGRSVNPGENIAPNEVPMDGRVGYFPQSDGSCIYAKAWNTDGTIKTIRYRPEQQEGLEEEAGKSENLSLSDIMQRLDDIESKITQRQRNSKRSGEAHA